MTNNEIYVGSDHGGFKLKNHLVDYAANLGYKVLDMGPYGFDSGDDYPDYVKLVCENVMKTKYLGIICCTTGTGVAVNACKYPGIYAGKCESPEEALQAKEHVGVNVLCLGEKNLTFEKAEEIMKAFLEAPEPQEERHLRRIEKIMGAEKRYMKPEFFD